MIHRTLDGSWAECSNPVCELKFHVPDLTAAEAEALPTTILYPLLEVIDPPTRRLKYSRSWEESMGSLHREYDLPAMIYADGGMEWYLHGSQHRGNDKPALVWPGLRDEWWVDGLRHREGGKPAVVWEDGQMEWWEHGKLVRGKGLTSGTD